MPKNTFFQELKRRSIYRVAITYTVVAWVLIQVASILLPTFEAPAWVMKVLTLVLIIGFLIALILAWAFEMSPDGMVRTTSTLAEDNPLPNHKRKPLTSNIMISVLLVILIGQWVYNMYWYKSVDETNIEQSIAVLPFADMSPNKDHEWFSDGVMEEILDHLVKINGLQITSRPSVMGYKGSTKKTDAIASELGVTTILTGSVRKAGERLKITVQLIDGMTDKQIWSDTFNGTSIDVFAFQSSIAQSVANKINAQITPEVKERMEYIPTQNIEAYNLYLDAIMTGDYASEKRENMLLEVARLDPNFGQAYVAMASIKLFRIIVTRIYLPENLDEYLEELKNLFNKGLQLDPNNAEANLWLGSMNLWFRWDFGKAKEYYQKAFQLNPASPQTAYTEFLLSTEKFDDAFQNSLRTVKANPNSSNPWLIQGLCHYFLNNQQMVSESIRIAEEKSESHLISEGNLYRLLIYQRRYKEVLTKYEMLSPNQGGPRIMCLAAIAYHHIGDQKHVEDILKSLKSQSEISPIGSPSFHVAMIYAQMGYIDLAYEWLDKAYKDHEVEMYWLKIEPPFESLHSDPRWQEMLDKVGFPN